MRARVHEAGNGFPSAGAYVVADGSIYRVLSTGNNIETHGPGKGHSVSADLIGADWSDCSDDDIFPARVVLLGSLNPAALQRAIAADEKAAGRVLRYLDRLGEEHSGRISGATLASVCGVDSRTWRKWVGGERTMPAAAWRLLIAVSRVRKPPPARAGENGLG